MTTQSDWMVYDFQLSLTAVTRVGDMYTGFVCGLSCYGIMLELH